MADWSEMMPALLIGIAKHLTSYQDQLNFAGVCHSWRSAASTLPNFFISPIRHPFLFLPDPPEPDPGNDADEIAAVRKLFILPSSLSNLNLPEARNRHSASSSRGWLITIGEDNTDVNLLNPLTRQQINLPNLDKFPCYHLRCGYQLQKSNIIRKLVLSCDPSSDEDCFVIIIWGFSQNLGFCRLGDDSWTEVWDGWHTTILDMTYHNRSMFLVTKDHKIMVLDLHSPNLEFSEFVDLPLKHFDHHLSQVYVLGGSDNNKLLMAVTDVVDYLGFNYTYRIEPFEVFELNLMEKSWSKVESLGNKAMFLGYNSSVMVDADGCAVEANCIYNFGEDSDENCRKMEIYDLCDGSMELHFSYVGINPPIWVEPRVNDQND